MRSKRKSNLRRDENPSESNEIINLSLSSDSASSKKKRNKDNSNNHAASRNINGNATHQISNDVSKCLRERQRRKCYANSRNIRRGNQKSLPLNTYFDKKRSRLKSDIDDDDSILSEPIPNLDQHIQWCKSCQNYINKCLFKHQTDRSSSKRCYRNRTRSRVQSKQIQTEDDADFESSSDYDNDDNENDLFIHKRAKHSPDFNSDIINNGHIKPKISIANYSNHASEDHLFNNDENDKNFDENSTLEKPQFCVII